MPIELIPEDNPLNNKEILITSNELLVPKLTKSDADDLTIDTVSYAWMRIDELLRFGYRDYLMSERNKDSRKANSHRNNIITTPRNNLITTPRNIPNLTPRNNLITTPRNIPNLTPRNNIITTPRNIPNLTPRNNIITTPRNIPELTTPRNIPELTTPRNIPKPMANGPIPIQRDLGLGHSIKLTSTFFPKSDDLEEGSL